WQLGVAQAVEVVAGLGVGAVQVLAAGLVLDQQHTLPEQVNVAILAINLLDPLLEAGDALAADAEDVEELVPEGLGLGILRGHIGPFLREAQGPILDLVPAQRRRLSGLAVEGLAEHTDPCLSRRDGCRQSPALGARRHLGPGSPCPAAHADPAAGSFRSGGRTWSGTMAPAAVPPATGRGRCPSGAGRWRTGAD